MIIDNTYLYTKIPDTNLEFATFLPEMIRKMHAFVASDSNNLGVAANQLGYQTRVFVMRMSNGILQECINPFWEPAADARTSLKEESCLSLPGISCKVKRYDKIQANYKTLGPIFHSEILTGLDAQIFQHETDHLEGKTILEVATRFHKDQALKNAKKRGIDVSKYYSSKASLKNEKYLNNISQITRYQRYINKLQEYRKSKINNSVASIITSSIISWEENLKKFIEGVTSSLYLSDYEKAIILCIDRNIDPWDTIPYGDNFIYNWDDLIKNHPNYIKDF